MHQLARLAFHWDAAKDQPRAFVAAVNAGLALRRVGLNEAMTYLERAVDLWDRVPDAEELCGVAKADLLRHLAVGAKVADGDEVRSIRFMREALSLVSEDADPLLASRIYSTYGELCHELDDAIGQLDAVSRALAHAEGTPSPELAGALMAMGQCEWRRQQPGAALAYFDRSRDVAREAGLLDHEADALSTSGFAAFELGQCAAGIQRLKDAERIAEAAGLLGLALYAHSDLAYLLLATGDVEQARELAVEGRARARALGLPDPAAMNGEQLSMLYRFTGRLDDADLILEELREQLMRPHRWRIERAENLLARGDLSAAMALERETMALINETAGIGDADHVLRQVRLLCGLGEVDEALELIGRYLDEVAGTDSPITRSCAAGAAWTALSSALDRGTEVPTGLAERAHALLELALDHATGEFGETYFAAEARCAAAMARRVGGDDALDEWRLADAAAARFGAYFVLQARLGLAEALLAAGQRDEGRALLVQVWDSARGMGARGRADEAAAVARRHRVQLAEDVATPRRLAALTPREREVFEVLVTGVTNRAIAERLFISEKTVSVHVSNLMAKLGVSSRGEAAALARDLEAADQDA